MSRCKVATGVLLCFLGFIFADSGTAVKPRQDRLTTLVSYSYFQKDEVQQRNFEFFMAVGMGIESTFRSPRQTDFVVVVNGDQCDPCKALEPKLLRTHSVDGVPDLQSARSGRALTLLQRSVNQGMDFAAHNTTLSWLQHTGSYSRYKFFIFLNSSVRGPFYPSYMPPLWQWTRGFTDQLRGELKLVAASLVCLPAIDAGGHGPKVESWTFAVEPRALSLLVQAGVFSVRTEKFGMDGVVIAGEYGLSNVLVKHGMRFGTLLARYGLDVDWQDSKHWDCNDNVHPSRHGTYGGIAMHPFESMFIKASWHVGEPYVKHYTEWFLDRARGMPDTAGRYNEDMYWYAISSQAENPPDVEQCLAVTPPTHLG